jgi:hypothetical protein
MPEAPILSAALAHEHSALVDRIRAQREQIERLWALAERLDEQARRDEHLLSELESVLGLSDQLRLEDLDARLRGRRLQEVAVEVLAERLGEGHEIHYRDWYALLQEAGYRIGGRDPLATFLAQVNRAPNVERIGRRTGRYRLQAA